LALHALQGKLHLPDAILHSARQRLEQPTPRIALGLALRGIASACADVSDGLLGDLGHILERSGLERLGVGATIDTTIAMNLLAACAHPTGANGTFDSNISAPQRLQCVLAGGDDYELVFTAAPAQRAAVLAASTNSGTAVTRIGQIDASAGLRLVDGAGAPVAADFASFDHFAA
jgi:thiamine-monophosphate kinase